MPSKQRDTHFTSRALIAGALLFFLGTPQAQTPTPPAAPASAPRLAAVCVACHGPQGNSTQPQFPSLAAQPKVFLENQLVLIRDGLRNIPPMKGLLDGVPDAELTELARYFSAQPATPAPASAVDAARYTRGQGLAHSMLCGTCHLPSYMGREQIPRLAGQHERFLREVMREYRDNPGPGRDTAMSAALYGLKDEHLDDLAHFLSHLRPTP